MHVTCTLQNWDFRPQREETTFHQLWEHRLENLHDTTVFSLLNCVKIDTKGNFTDEVESEQYI